MNQKNLNLKLFLVILSGKCRRCIWRSGRHRNERKVWKTQASAVGLPETWGRDFIQRKCLISWEGRGSKAGWWTLNTSAPNCPCKNEHCSQKSGQSRIFRLQVLFLGLDRSWKVWKLPTFPRKSRMCFIERKQPSQKKKNSLNFQPVVADRQQLIN